MLPTFGLFAANAVFVSLMSVSEIQGHPVASSSPRKGTYNPSGNGTITAWLKAQSAFDK